jgi:hypothetical protein
MRKQDWPTQLQAEIDRHKNIPFQWGVSDCVQFSKDCVQSVLDPETWDNKFHDFEFPVYASEEIAEQLITEDYDGNIGNLYSLFFKAKRVRFAQSGDLVTFKLNDKIISGIVDLSGRYIVAKSPSGVAYFPVKLALSAWGVE